MSYHEVKKISGEVGNSIVTKCPKVEGLILTFCLSIVKQKNNKYLLFSKLSV
jgi:hypothetical protein